MDRRVIVVAVSAVAGITVSWGAILDRCSCPVPVPVRIYVPEQFDHVLVHLSVAVIVYFVAKFRGGRMDVIISVVTIGIVCGISLRGRAGVGGFFRTPISVSIRIFEENPQREIFIDRPVAVVVHSVADFFRAGVGRSDGVIAIGAVGDISVRLCAGLDGRIRIPISIPVRISIRGCGCGIFIYFPVAIIVRLVADLVRTWIDSGVLVIAVVSRLRVPRGHTAGGDGCVRSAVIIAIPVQEKDGVVEVFVDQSIAVVVRLVADFVRVGMGVRVGVVAVPLHHRASILIAIYDTRGGSWQRLDFIIRVATADDPHKNQCHRDHKAANPLLHHSSSSACENQCRGPHARNCS